MRIPGLRGHLVLRFRANSATDAPWGAQVRSWWHVSRINREQYRKRAAECVELARVTTDPETKRILLAQTQEWLKLAYAQHEEFGRLLEQFNSKQLGGSAAVQPDIQESPGRLADETD